MQHFRTEEIVDWITMKEAVQFLKQLTCNTYSVQSLYAWAKQGRLKTNGYRPLKTTRKLLRDFAREYLGLRLEQ